VTSNDKEFVAATIQAIGRCASNIEEVSDACLTGLMGLVSHRDEAVVAESVVVIKTLLQMRPSEQKESIIQMAKLADRVKVPMARASILWLIGEYSERMPKLAPDVLRKMAKSFPNEENIVKMQVLNLAAKLSLTNPKQTKLLCQYVLNMAKYDLNYDIRDRARFLRTLLVPAEKTPLSKYNKKMFLTPKPAPVLQSAFKDHSQWQMGSLSHMLNNQANGYKPLPDFPEEPPDPTVRNVEVEIPWQSSSKAKSRKKRMKTGLDAFYDSESSEVSGSESGESESESGSESGSGSESEESGSEDGSHLDSYSEVSSATETEDSEAASSSVEDNETTEEESSEESEDSRKESKKKPKPVKPPAAKQTKVSLSLYGICYSVMGTFM
jgi:AP-3 complex subunit beta